jgi:hypothetical protein
MNQALIDQLAALFAQTGQAHHQAFIEVDGADPDWPLWYAEQLLLPLRQLLEAHFTKSELVYLLVLLDREMRTVAPGADWTRFNAQRLAERYPK